MSAREIFGGACLVAGVGVQLVALLGLLRARDPFDRLHLVVPAGVLGAPLVCAAILINESFTMGGIKAIVTGVVLATTGPVLSHATARAVRLRATRHVGVLPSEARDAHGG